jgi:hypothetical protein
MVYLMHDTDIGGDSDDMGEVFTLLGLADLGECQSLSETATVNGVLSSGVTHHKFAQCLEIAHNWWGNYYVPLGTLRDRSCKSGDNYASAIVSQYSSYLLRYPSQPSIPNALPTMRSALASATDGSVHMVTTGMLTNLRLLYESPPDEISPLTGAQLMRQKLNELVIALGSYGYEDEGAPIFPEGDDICNLPTDTWGAEVINALEIDADIKVVWCDLGYNILLNASGRPASPLKRATELFGGASWHCWGEVAILYAVRGLTWGGLEYFHYSDPGTRHYTPPAHVKFTFNPTGHQYWLYRSQPKSAYSSIINGLAWATPTKKDTAYIASVTPDRFYRDTTIDPLILTGKLFTGASAVSLGDGISVHGFHVDNDAQITLHPSIGPGAAPGFRDISVVTPAGTTTKPDALEILYVDCHIGLALVCGLGAFNPLENVGTWGCLVELEAIGNYQPPSSKEVNFDLVQVSPPAWDEVNWTLGSGIGFPDIGLYIDHRLSLGDPVDIRVTMQDLAKLLISPYFYQPPDGKKVNFVLEQYSPVPWNEVNWIWPLHCLVDLSAGPDIADVWSALGLVTDQILSMPADVSDSLALADILLRTDQLLTIPSNAPDSLALMDYLLPSVVIIVAVTVDDVLVLSDSPVPGVELFPAISDVLTLSDDLNKIFLWLEDTLVLSDSLRVRLPHPHKPPQADGSYSLGDVAAAHSLGTMQERYTLGPVKGRQP